MKLLGNNGTLVLELSELGAAGTPAHQDVLLNVTVDASGFAANDQSWVTAKEWIGFLGELRALEQSRQGRAILVAASPEDLRLEFFSTDRAGHMAVQGQVRRRTVERFELQLRFGFAFEPDELPRILRGLEAITPGLRCPEASSAQLGRASTDAATKPVGHSSWPGARLHPRALVYSRSRSVKFIQGMVIDDRGDAQAGLIALMAGSRKRDQKCPICVNVCPPVV